MNLNPSFVKSISYKTKIYPLYSYKKKSLTNKLKLKSFLKSYLYKNVNFFIYLCKENNFFTVIKNVANVFSILKLLIVKAKFLAQKKPFILNFSKYFLI